VNSFGVLFTSAPIESYVFYVFCTVHCNKIVQYKCKSKANPLQTWTGPEGSRRLRFPDFKTIGT